MKSRRSIVSFVFGLTLICLFCPPELFAAPRTAAGRKSSEKKAKTVRDVLWVWGNPEMTQPGEHTLSTFAEASPAQRAELLGIPNVVMAGSGLPHAADKAARLTEEVKRSPQLVWEIVPDGQRENKPPFIFDRRIADLKPLVKKHPQIEAVLLDDMTSVAASRGFRPEHIRNLRSSIQSNKLPLDIWGVLYTMNLPKKITDALVRELDVINLWTWHAKDVVDLEQNVAECEKRYPGKPIVLGLYLYDYGGGRLMPRALHERQCATALELVQSGRVQGIVFLTIKNDPDTLQWTADWIRRVGSRKLAGASQIKRKHRRFKTAGLDRRRKQSAQSSRGESNELLLKIGDDRGWDFSGQPWTQNEQGVISPPNVRNLHSRAFYTQAALADFTAEFEFNGNYRETGTGSAGLVFRAADMNHFYMVHFPWGGQQLRAKHFWVSLVKVDGDGYQRSLKSAWVPGVPSETGRWYKVRVTVKGPKVDVIVDGRRALSFSDDSYKKGVVGLAGYGWYFFRNIRINGRRLSPPKWDDNQTIPVHHFTVGLDSRQMPTSCIAPNGDVLLAAGNLLVRSKDKGRTWSTPETMPKKLGMVGDYGNTMFRTSKDRLIIQMWQDREQTKKNVPGIMIAESKDNGRTWSDPVAAHVATGWPEVPSKLICYGPLVETADGTLLRFMYGSTREKTLFTDVRTFGAVHVKAYVVRSTDGDKSWSAAIEMDQHSWSGVPRGTLAGSLDFTEPTGVAVGNKVTVLIRPIYSPFMWQCTSHDAGATWDAAARTTFPGYAQSMVRTHSGAILCAHRYPQYAVNVSRDNGLNWDDGTIIDFPAWAMGSLIEVEPNVVLATFMNWKRDQPLLAQLFRVTPKGVFPVAR